MDPSGAFVIAPEAVSLQDQIEILLVCISAAFSGRLACTPVVVSGSGDPGNLAELPDFQEVAFAQRRLMDKIVKQFPKDARVEFVDKAALVHEMEDK